MSEVRTLGAILRSTCEEMAWHGPAVMEALEGLTLADALKRPIPNTHTIRELVAHMDAWQRYTLVALEGTPVAMLEGEENFPVVSEETDAEWEEAKRRFKANNESIREGIAQLDDAQLSELVPGRDHPMKMLLHGIAHHNVYHAGQIILLRKALS